MSVKPLIPYYINGSRVTSLEEPWPKVSEWLLIAGKSQEEEDRKLTLALFLCLCLLVPVPTYFSFASSHLPEVFPSQHGNRLVMAKSETLARLHWTSIYWR